MAGPPNGEGIPNTGSIEILLVEDNLGDARLVEILLSEASSPVNFMVAHTEYLADALERLKETTFGVILLDLSLPDSSGLETVSWMRAAAPRTPIVVMSGQAEEKVALQALHLGAQDYLVKGQGDGNLIARSVLYSIERKRSQEDLRQREQQLEVLVGKLITAQEEERRRVAYEVHDGLTQVAIATHQHLQAFVEDHPPGSIVEEGELDRAVQLARRTVGEARRVIAGLRPTALDDFGLAAAMEQDLEALNKAGLGVRCETDLGEERLPTEVETTLYRVAQEALTNARKHARAERVEVSLRKNDRKVRLEVRDTGRGFDPEAVPEASGSGERVGLASMRERVALIGGDLTLTSRLGEGTSVVAEVPLRLPAGATNEVEA
ncbi:MAG TPA: ATP-binding protein [Rubrobacter sp.]